MTGLPADAKASFRSALPARIAALEEASRLLAERQDGALDSIRRLAHTLRGSGGTFGFPEVSAAAAALEEAALADVPRRVLRLITVLRTAAQSGPAAQQSILVVEDDPVASALLQAALQAPGRSVHAAETTLEAEMILENHEIALIVLDLVLPDVDGRNLIVRLRENPLAAHIPIVVVSGLTSAQVRAECFVLGADDYITKPVDGMVLAARVSGLLARGAGPVPSGAAPAATAPGAAGPEPDGGGLPEPAGRPSRVRATRLTLRIPSLPGPILVAEDDDLIAAVITHRLKREGLDVQRFADGLTVLEAAKGVQAALVVLDVKMPRMDGFEVLRQLRALPSYARTPIVMLTSMGSEHDIARGLELGADDYIVKPFSPVEFVARVVRYVRRRRRVLLVDDDPLIIVAGRAALRAGGFEVDTAESAEEALAQIERELPEAVISDITLPGVGGTAFIERLRGDGRTRDLRVMVLTANPAEFGPERASALSVREVMAKPFDPLALADAVSRLLRD